MQPNDIQTKVVENIGENLGEWLRAVPSELVNIIPESVWMSLSVDQKKEMLRQHNILDKYAGNKQEAPAQAPAVVMTSESTPALIVEQEQRFEKNPEFEKALAEFKEANKEKETDELETKPVLSQEEVKRVNEEKAQNSNTQSQSYNFFGYQPSNNIFTNAKQLAQTGDISDSKTWASTLISKIFSLFQ